MHTFLKEIQLATRSLLRSRLFAVVAIGTLSLGIGANTAIFTLLNALILRPLAVPEASRVVRVFSGRQGGSRLTSYPNYIDFREAAQSYSQLAVYSWPVPISLGPSNERRGAPSERVWATVVSGNYFETLGVGAELGRTFSLDEDRVPNEKPVVVVSHSFWERKLDSNPQIAGQTIKLNGDVFEVIGVVPATIPRTDMLFATDLWIPMMMQAEAMPGQGQRSQSRTETFLSILGRLRPQVSMDQARAEATALGSRLAEQYPNENHDFTLAVLTELEGRRRILPGLDRVGWVLLAIVGLVLLIACVNISGLLLARGVARRKEFAIRLALGAGRSQLIRQLLTEGLILSLFGGALGLAVGAASLRLLVNFMPPLPIEISADTSFDIRVLLFSLTISLAAGVFFSVLPAFHSTRLDLSGTIKASDQGPRHSSGRLLARDVLVVAQVAVSLVLLIMAGLFVRSLVNAQQADVGFDPNNRLLATVDTGLVGYTPEQSRLFDARLLQEVRSLPGVIDASATAFAPLGPGYLGDGRVYVEGESPLPDERRPRVYYDKVSPAFFRAMGTPILAGRDFTRQDVDSIRPVAIVNQTFAKSFWPGESPVGKRFRLNTRSSERIEVIGLVKDGKYQSLGELPQRHIYLANATPSLTLVLHTAGDPHLYAEPVRAAVRRLDASLPVTDIRTMTDHLGLALYPARMTASLLGMFSLLGLFLAMMGLYGLLTFVVQRRTREVGIRMALGAQPFEVLWLVIRQGTHLVIAGMALGLLGGYLASGLVSGILYGLSGWDLPTFAAVSCLMSLVALLAMYLPARQASRVDPIVALRYE